MTFRAFLRACLLFLAACAPVGAKESAAGRAALVSPVEEITRAYRAGQLSDEQSLIQRVLAVRDPGRLQPRFRSPGGPASRCGSAVFHELAVNWNRLSAPTRAALAPYRARPTSSGIVSYDKAATVKSFNSSGGHFKIHYVTSTVDAPPLTDSDSDGTADFVESVAGAFDAAWQRYVVELGFTQPLSDFPGPGGAEDGGDGRFDVYLAEIADSRGALGLEVIEFEGGNPVRDTAVGFILFDNDFLNSGFTTVTPLELMQVTAAHEFMHAVQDAYETDDQRLPDGSLNFWYSEASAAWGEKEVCPGIDAILERLPGWFEYPEVAMDAYADADHPEHEYGSMLLNVLLTAKYGAGTVRRMWESLSRQPDGTDLTSLQALDVVLTQLGSSRSGLMREFFVWNYLTGANADGRHYPEAAKYPAMFVSKDHHTHAVYPVQSPSPLPYKPAHLGSNYVSFLPPTPAGGALKVEFDGQDSAQWSAQLIAVTAGASPGYVPLTLALDSAGQTGSRTVDWAGLSRVVLVAGVLSVSGEDCQYTYRATTVAAIPPKVAGSAATPTSVEVTFDAPVVAGDATTVANYRLESPAGTNRSLAGAALSYNAATRTARLTGLALSPAATYRVTVTGVRHADTNAPLVADGSGNVSSGTVSRPAASGFLLEVNGGLDDKGRGLYSLVALPLSLTDPNPATYFGAGVKLATYDPRLGANVGEYLRFTAQAPNFGLEPGRGYFLQSTADSLVWFDGAAVPATQPFSVSLPAASWYLMGNPFAQPLAWDLDALRYRHGANSGTLREALASANPPAEPYAWVWNTDLGDFEILFDKSLVPEARSVLRPGEGAFVFCNATGASLELASSTGKAAASRASRPVGGWSAEIVAQGGEARSSSRRSFGVAPGGLPRGVRISPPPAAAPGRAAADLHFLETETGRALAVDLQPAGRATPQWRFVATSELPGAEVVLSWPDLSAVPKQLGLRLVDLQTGKQQSLRSTRFYRYRAGDSPREFRLEAYPTAEGNLTVTGVSIRPAGRGGPGPGISFTLSRAADVQVRLLTTSGRTVSTTAKPALPAGLNALDLAGRTGETRALATGVYLVEVVARAEEGQAAKVIRAMRVR
ncbi:MAG: hypothetical protein COY42_23440 [Armatimonadetes bacterium CG_4_10_14_0_8_um_filter_66_14]|nr:hypothetical protein [Armatimonadota bacterium]OIP02728.1 MAG: hypothetical protein AUJ96_15950 [Armatimonadetes bacterium CG2_30_66_41]PIU92669.1 MAG: hypothetical protein COS65_16705 [Armatimonadetes bacterium CG06_land_8_20_14_3_00_66_21]PIX48723.1 MAG: hypothetical protein COZ57_04905 [Armatimonadetes bacterium CG_4_8_14_3_um_filter_66_20]PIZ38171.1 MAG: hypothetical protein COY42_23440 [Armatimonadetes bacterium CG_4_10_14_0_8_um_filter_66_14]PJB61994.1 MAG: hypothetical protein CO096_